MIDGKEGLTIGSLDSLLQKITKKKIGIKNLWQFIKKIKGERITLARILYFDFWNSPMLRMMVAIGIILRLFLSFFLLTSSIISSVFLSGFSESLRASERSEWARSKAIEITERMSVEDLVGQVIHIAIPGKSVETQTINEIKKTRPGGIILFGKNLGKKLEIIRLTEDLQKETKELGLPPLFISTDQEGGRVFRVRDGMTEYPGAMALGQTGSSDFGRVVGFVTSYELKRVGINFLFAPVLDVNNNPWNPVINTRSFGSDAKRVSEVAVSYELGAREGGALPVIKHFPGHGDTNVDSHLGLPIIQKNIEELESLELIPFRKSIASGAQAVMTAHIVYPQIDEKFPATLSKTIIQEILRNKLGFDGIIITDAMEMNAISKNYADIRPSVQAIKAGATIVLLTSWGETPNRLRNEIFKAYEAGEFQVEGIDLLKKAVSLQIQKKIENGLYSFSELGRNDLQADWENLEKARKAKYENLMQKKAFLIEISEESIRSFPEAMKPIELSKTVSFCKNTFAKQGIGDKIPPKSINVLSKELKRKEITTYIFDSTSEKEIQTIAKLARISPEKTFVILHAGSPFLPFPRYPNLKYLFSFSLTEESWKALGRKAASGRPIPKADLILIPEDSKAPEKTAFPEKS